MAPPDVLADELFGVIGQLRRRTRQVVGVPFAGGSLTGAEVDVVRHLCKNPDSSVKDTADAIGMAPNTVSTLVKGLAQRGFLTRTQDHSDRRISRLSLTPDTLGRVGNWRRRRLAIVVKAVSRLDAEERATLEDAIDVLARLTALIEEAQDA